MNLSYLTCHHRAIIKQKSPGFDYNFNALSCDPEKNELMKSFSILFKSGQKLSATVVPILKAMYPALSFIVRIAILTSPFYHFIYIGLQPAPNDYARLKAKAVMNRIGMGLLKQSKGDTLSHCKDVLSVLSKANSMEEKAHQMKDEDVVSRAYELILNWCILLIYFQRLLLSLPLVMKQQGTVPLDILQLTFTIFLNLT